MSKNFTLKAHKIYSENDLKTYKKSIFHIGFNPFYSRELIHIQCTKEQQLYYFSFYIDEKLMVLMPFYKRKISPKINNLNYFDSSSPYGYTGPLISEKASKNDLIIFWKYVDEWYKKENIISEFIRFNLNDNILGYSGVLIPSLKNIKGKIIETELQWQGFKQKVRNNYRKAVNENLELKIFTKENISSEIVGVFYEIYISTMKRNNANSIYFHPKDYFENFVYNNKEASVIAIVFKDNIPISTELILVHNDTLYSFLGGTLADYFHTRPNDFLKIEVMNWARNNNFKNYVLGGGRTDNDGLYKYKKSFFPKDEDITFYTGRKILNKTIYKELVKNCSDEANIEAQLMLKDSFFPYYRKNERN